MQNAVSLPVGNNIFSEGAPKRSHTLHKLYHCALGQNKRQDLEFPGICGSTRAIVYF